MEFLKKIQVSKIPVITDREAFCKKHCPHDKRLPKCYMCHSVDEEEIREWLQEHSDQYLYIMTNDHQRLPRRCPWCDDRQTTEPVEDHAWNHGKSIDDFHVFKTQQDIHQELLQVYRTGRWWALSATMGHCVACVEPNSYSCSLDVTPRSKSRCVFSLCLDPRKFLRGCKRTTTGFVLV